MDSDREERAETLFPNSKFQKSISQNRINQKDFFRFMKNQLIFLSSGERSGDPLCFVPSAVLTGCEAVVANGANCAVRSRAAADLSAKRNTEGYCAIVFALSPIGNRAFHKNFNLCI